MYDLVTDIYTFDFFLKGFSYFDFGLLLQFLR